MSLCLFFPSHQILQQVSALVRDEVRALFYGNQLALGGGASPDGAVTAPESLLEWLSQHYVSTSDLQAALSSLELGILRNVSLLVGGRRSGRSGAKDAPHGAAVTLEVSWAAEEASWRPNVTSLISCCSSRTSM